MAWTPRAGRGLCAAWSGQGSGVRCQEALAALAASLTRRSQLATSCHVHLFTQSYARWLLENNWPDSKRPRFSLSLELPRFRRTLVTKHASNLARGSGVAIRWKDAANRRVPEFSSVRFVVITKLRSTVASALRSMGRRLRDRRPQKTAEAGAGC
jgi:hypothetical protein